MKVYYKRPDLTAKVMTVDGWFDTGDIGILSIHDEIVLKGRMKDTIVLRGGENIEPLPIEQKLQESRFIKAAVVVGDGADGRSFQHHGDGRQHLTCDGVFYDTLDVYRVLRQRPCRPWATEGQEHEQSAENSSCHFGSMGRGSEKMGRESRAFRPRACGVVSIRT